MSKTSFEYGFLKRTFMYGGAGLCGVAVDLSAFGSLTFLGSINPLWLINILTYSLGTCTSFYFNRKFSFRSQTRILSFVRFYLISILGMLISTFLLLFLTHSFWSLPLAKTISTVLAISSQYFLNTKFSLVKKS
jgi:putative flippase GtrA